MLELSQTIGYTQYGPQIRRYVAARLDGPAVDDVVQQVFLKANEKIHTLSKPKLLKAWLYRIAQYTIIDRYRQEGKQYYAPNDPQWWDSIQSPDHSQQHTAQSIASCLIPMIQHLEPHTQQVLDYYMQGLPLQNIADKTELSLSNVKVIIHRSKQKLASMYQSCCSVYRDEQGNLIDTWCKNDCGCSARDSEDD